MSLRLGDALHLSCIMAYSQIIKCASFLMLQTTHKASAIKSTKDISCSKPLNNAHFLNHRLILLEDGLLVLVASLESKSYFGIPQRLYIYYHNPHSITKDKSLQRFHTRQAYFDKLLHITAHLLTIYPQYHTIIKKYQHKVASTLMIESRDFSSFEMYESLQILHKHHLHKIYDIPPYLKSTLISLSYAFRWQNLVRLLGFICSFGKLRL